jgi:predicted  nucleic acid-binding Zn-ribbon protein
MTEQPNAIGSLREIQKIDERLREIMEELRAFDDRLAEVEEPSLRLETELNQLTERLANMEADERRLERAADDKRARAEKMDQRLNKVSNLREEAAVKTELDLVKKAITVDEQEALQLIDQIRRTQIALEDLAARTREAREQVGPRQEDLLREREGLSSLRKDLERRREEKLTHVTPRERKVYDAFHHSRRAVIVATLLEDGACGHCYGVIPLQIQNVVRRGSDLIRCEACGVILTAQPENEIDPELASILEAPLRTEVVEVVEVVEEVTVTEGDAE